MRIAFLNIWVLILILCFSVSSFSQYDFENLDTSDSARLNSLLFPKLKSEEGFDKIYFSILKPCDLIEFQGNSKKINDFIASLTDELNKLKADKKVIFEVQIFLDFYMKTYFDCIFLIENEIVESKVGEHYFRLHAKFRKGDYKNETIGYLEIDYFKNIKFNGKKITLSELERSVEDSKSTLILLRAAPQLPITDLVGVMEISNKIKIRIILE